jgi:hypothetical protein
MSKGLDLQNNKSTLEFDNESNQRAKETQQTLFGI